MSSSNLVFLCFCYLELQVGGDAGQLLVAEELADGLYRSSLSISLPGSFSPGPQLTVREQALALLNNMHNKNTVSLEVLNLL